MRRADQHAVVGRGRQCVDARIGEHRTQGDRAKAVAIPHGDTIARTKPQHAVTVRDDRAHERTGKSLGSRVQREWPRHELARAVVRAEPHQPFPIDRHAVDVIHDKAIRPEVAADDLLELAELYIKDRRFDEALKLSKAFERLGITLFEQPVPMSDVYAMKKLIASSGLTIALDEAAVGLPYVIELIRREAVEGLAIKVSKVGGLHYARQMCDLALNAGLTLIGSGLMDAPIGFAASVHLFAAYGIRLPVDLNGPQFIAEDYLREPLPIERQVASVPPGPGLGVTIDEARVARFRLDLQI